MTNEEKKMIIELREKGLSFGEIAKKTSLPKSSIAYFLSNYNKPSNKDVCKYCGITLKHVKGKRKKVFCSYKCRMKYWKEHKTELNQKSKIEKTCEFCGKKYIDYPSKRKRFCSYECYVNFERWK